jgi:hypothetical protein
MEHEGSLPSPQECTTASYPKPDESSSCPHTLFFKIHFNIILSSTPRSSNEQKEAEKKWGIIIIINIIITNIVQLI